MNNNLILPGGGSWVVFVANAFTPSVFPRKMCKLLLFEPVFMEEVRAIYRKYECSVDVESSFNPLLFPGIVPPRCDLYDKIVYHTIKS